MTICHCAVYPVIRDQQIKGDRVYVAFGRGRKRSKMHAGSSASVAYWRGTRWDGGAQGAYEALAYGMGVARGPPCAGAPRQRSASLVSRPVSPVGGSRKTAARGDGPKLALDTRRDGDYTLEYPGLN